MDNKKARLCGQKVIGAAILLFAFAFLWLCSTSWSAAERDCTVVAILLPLGLYLLFTKQPVLM